MFRELPAFSHMTMGGHVAKRENTVNNVIYYFLMHTDLSFNVHHIFLLTRHREFAV